MYCSRCGRKLEEGEVCTCTQETQNQQSQGQEEIREQQSPLEDRNQGKIDTEGMKEKGVQAVGMIKDFLRDMGYILRKPVSGTLKLVEKNSIKAGIRFIAVKAVLMIAIVLIAASKLEDQLGGWIEMPYGRLFMLTLILTIGMDCIESLILNGLGKPFGETTSLYAMYSVTGVRAVYDITITVATAILLLLSETAALLVFLAGVLLIPYIQYASYRVSVKADENKKVYAFFAAKICTIIIFFILVFLFGKDTLSDIQQLLGLSNW